MKPVEIKSVYGDLTWIDLDKVVAFQDAEGDCCPITKVWLAGLPHALDLDIAYCQFLNLMNSNNKRIKKK